MKVTSVVLTILLCFCSVLQAETMQSTAGEWAVKFNKLASEERYDQAVESGINACIAYYAVNNYTDAFNICRNMDQLIRNGEQKLQKPFYKLRFQVTYERLQMYMKLKSTAQAQIQLKVLTDLTKQANDPALTEDLLYAQTNYYYTFGMFTQGDASFQELTDMYKDKKEYDKVSECYKKMIEIATKANNAPMVARTYEKYIVWTDSVKALTAQDKLSVLQKKYDESLQTIQEKDDTLAGKQYLIVTLCVFAVILIAALIVLAFIWLRFVAMNKKLKKNIQIANEHNELKTQFIQNISAQMAPTLDSLDSAADALKSSSPEQVRKMKEQVDALKKFSADIQELSSLENSLMEVYEVRSINVGNFCKKAMEKIEADVHPEVEIQVDAPQFEIKTNPEQLERILLHLLKNATLYTTSGKIKLEFKKRGAHSCQFVVTDSGTGIPADKQANLFKPFSEIKNLAEGDGLGLPICSLIAAKINGSLTLDPEYKRGCRFVLNIQG